VYAYDPVGNLLEVRHHAGRDLFRPGPELWRRRYRYAEGGNRLLSTSRPGEERLLPYGTEPGYADHYAHESHGGLVSMPHLPEFRWSGSGRLAEVELADGGRVHYTYGTDGCRVRAVWERRSGLVEERVHLGDRVICRLRGAGGVLVVERQTLHLTDGWRGVATAEVRTVGTDPGPAQLLHYRYADLVGSSTLELDAQAQIVSYTEYYPFGSVAYRATRSAREMPVRFRFAGAEWDAATGLTVHGNRYYAPWLGRWVGPGSTDARFGGNPYAYADNAPTRPANPPEPGQPFPRAFPDSRGHFHVDSSR
jgi:RHS repeat-associated protein